MKLAPMHVTFTSPLVPTRFPEPPFEVHQEPLSSPFYDME